jgi:integrase
LSALPFLYGKVLGLDLPWTKDIGRPRHMRRLPVVSTPDEVAAVVHHLAGEQHLFARLLDGTGMRLMERLQLRVEDLDFGRRANVVRHGKGDKDRIAMLPQCLEVALNDPLASAHSVRAADQAARRRGPTHRFLRRRHRDGPASGGALAGPCARTFDPVR